MTIINYFSCQVVSIIKDAKRRRILGPRTQKEQENYDRIKPRTTNDMSIAELDDNIASIEELDEIQVLSPDPPFELPMQIRTESKIISDMLKEAVEKTYSKMEYDYVIGLNTTGMFSMKNCTFVVKLCIKLIFHGFQFHQPRISYRLLRMT